MRVAFKTRIQAPAVMMLLGIVCLLLGVGSQPWGAGNVLAGRAQAPETPQPDTAYFTSRTITLRDGTSLEEYTINGPPDPPPGYEHQRTAVGLPEANYAMATNSLVVPAFDWVFGCSSVSGAMIAGYYDRNGYPNMYIGPTNGGVMPLDNSSWPTWTDASDDTYPNLPLAASHNGIDGRTVRGSIDDYWVAYGSKAQDPYITNGWAEHTWGDAIGDYMKTSQSAYDNTDGSTTFYNWTSSASPLTCSAMESYGISADDGTYGIKLFYEARGYPVTDCYSQKTDNTIAGGFSFTQFKAEIDAGRPVMLNLEGHTVVGVGYDDSGNKVYIHDTWDYSTHTMTWGGSYAGMALLSVSVVHPETATTPVPTRTPTNTRTRTPTNTPRRSATNTRTRTSTRTPTSIPTWTPTSTPTWTATNTPTCTPTQTPTLYPTWTPTGTPTPTPEPAALGEVNGDGLADSTDALIVLSADAGIDTEQFCPLNCGDVNGDGYVDSTDALIVLSYDAGMNVPFPVGQPGCPASVAQPPGCSP